MLKVAKRENGKVCSCVLKSEIKSVDMHQEISFKKQLVWMSVSKRLKSFVLTINLKSFLFWNAWKEKALERPSLGGVV